jgi:hypothetical protein
MEKTKGILIKLYLNYVDNNFDNDIISIEELKSALYEVLDNQEIFIVDLAIYIEESKKKNFYENDSNREYCELPTHARGDGLGFKGHRLT